MGIIQHSSNKKIDVDDLKQKLAHSVKRDNRYSQSQGVASTFDSEAVKRRKNSRSKSPLGASHGDFER